jgi:hypothetical protein
MMLRDFAHNVAPLEKTYESTPNLGGFKFEIDCENKGIEGNLCVTEIKKS